MVALGRPGRGRGNCWPRRGFVVVQRLDVPVRVGVRADPETYAPRRRGRVPAPAYEAIQAVGEQAFHERGRAGSPTEEAALRASACRCAPRIAVTGYLARKG